jgi:hypothetical protein
VARYGVPDAITSDRGKQFVSEVLASTCQRMGIEVKLTTAYHPQANGLIERFHRQLKDALRARTATADWDLHLPLVLLGLRAAPKEDENVSAAELAFGTRLTLPGELLGAPLAEKEELSAHVEAAATNFQPLPLRERSYAEVAAYVPELLKEAKFVYIRRGGVLQPLAARYDGPYEVKARRSKYFEVLVGQTVDRVSVDRLKPHVGADPAAVAQPPRRGRPPLLDTAATAVLSRGGSVAAQKSMKRGEKIREEFLYSSH